jgi:hypothetical protein
LPQKLLNCRLFRQTCKAHGNGIHIEIWDHLLKAVPVNQNGEVDSASREMFGEKYKTLIERAGRLNVVQIDPSTKRFIAALA